MANRFGNNIRWEAKGTTLELFGRGMVKQPPVPETKWTRLIINEGIIGIDAYAFMGFASLTEVELPKSLMVISEYAFADCWSLGKIGPIPSLNFIEKNAFDHTGCHSLIQALEEAGPTLVPYSYRIFTRFGEVRLAPEVKKVINGLPLREQLARVRFAKTSNPMEEKAEGYIDVQFEDLYKIIMDGNSMIGVVLKSDSRETDTWTFLATGAWEQYNGSSDTWVRMELRDDL